LQIGAVHLAPQHRHLVAQHQQLDVDRPAVPGKLGQHPQDLAQQQVHQRSTYSLGSSQLPPRRPRTEQHLKQLNLIYGPHTLLPFFFPHPRPPQRDRLRGALNLSLQ